MPDVETEQQTQEEVAAAALASWKAAKDVASSEQSMRDQLTASTAVRRAGPTKTEWEAREAEIAAKEEQARTDRAAAEQHRREKNEFLSFAQSRYALAKRNGNQAVADVWFGAAEAITKDKWPISKHLNTDPGMTRFQGLRSRLNYQGKNVRLKD